MGGSEQAPLNSRGNAYTACFAIASHREGRISAFPVAIVKSP